MIARSNQQRGFLLVTVAVGLLLLSVVSLMVIETGSYDAALRSRQLNHRGLEYTAEAAITEARWRLRNNTSCDNYGDVAATTFGSNTYSATVVPNAGSPVSVSAIATDGDGNSVTTVENIAVTTVPNPLTLQPAAVGSDTYLRDGANDDNNFGAADILKVNNSSAEEASLLQFDLTVIPSGSVVQSATLELWLEGGQGLSNGILDVHRVTQAWVEGTRDGSSPTPGQGATYNSYDGQTNWASAGGDYETPPLDTRTIPTLTSAWYSWDVTAAASDWVDNSSANDGVLLRASGGNVQKIWFTSGDSASTRHPRLTVTYACECGASCVASTESELPIAHWKLDDASGTGAVDSVGSHDGSLENGPVWSNQGKLDGALDFDGIDDRIAVPDDAGLDITSAISFSAWIKNDTTMTGGYRILSKESSGANDSYWLAVQGANLWMGIGGEFFSAPVTLSANQWYHVAGTFDSDAGEVKMFIDGFEVLVAATTATLTPNADPLYIGGNWQSNRYWSGLLDDVRINDRVLSESEIIDLSYVPMYCDAAYAPDNKVSSFSLVGAGYVFGRGTTYFPEGRTLGATTAPAGGAWVSVGNTGRLVMTDMSGTVLDDTFDTGLTQFHGITYLPAGEHAGKMVAVFNSSLYLIDPTVLPATASYSIIDLSAFADWTKGVTYVDGGTYDKHVAVVDDTNMEIYVLDQDWNEVQTINLGALTGNAKDLAHVRGSDNFFVMNGTNDQVVMIDATETLGLIYDVAQFGYDNPASIAVHPVSCQHLVSDNTDDEYGYLNIGSGGGGGGPAYVEMFAIIGGTQEDVWEMSDLSTFGVPANAVVEVAVINSNSGREREGGVRSVGSNEDRVLELHETEGGGEEVVVMHVQADGSGRIEHWVEDDFDVYFALMGYWTIGSYQENWDEIKSDSDAKWVNYNLSSSGVGASEIAEIVIANENTGAQRYGGVRPAGSGLDRTLQIHEAESGGVDASTMLVGADGTSGARIEVYKQDGGDITMYVAGHWETPPGKFNPTMSTPFDPGSPSGTWSDWDLTSYRVPPNSVVEIAVINRSSSRDSGLGVRAKGSTQDDRFLYLQEAESGGGDTAVWHVNAGANSVIQWYAENAGDEHHFVVLGWWVTSP